MPADSGLLDYLLRLADNGLVLAQRLGEWVGKGPVIEEDIASTNVGLDLSIRPIRPRRRAEAVSRNPMGGLLLDRQAFLSGCSPGG